MGLFVVAGDLVGADVDVVVIVSAVDVEADVGFKYVLFRLLGGEYFKVPRVAPPGVLSSFYSRVQLAFTRMTTGPSTDRQDTCVGSWFPTAGPVSARGLCAVLAPRGCVRSSVRVRSTR
ncbi:hypothetical protein K1T71_011584 [Dendrolimus kikuchii]|uniref:Uncharacterized protein n=1 Tax=Dendrolimus kikuchii TaxID=765133 RepID=A0ACC1CLH2_9NEOP|nr:hypothetical protein K1T71_011584 [Dendrolimus kikuchii]